jgi:hypothetical protein
MFLLYTLAIAMIVGGLVGAVICADIRKGFSAILSFVIFLLGIFLLVTVNFSSIGA